MTSAERRSLVSYAAACLSIYLQVYDRGLARPLRDVECVLCEDGITVLLQVRAGADSWITASFELPEKIDDDAFEPRPYLEGFEE
jgi:hypothetical protein